jgi:hypothetical protein
MPMPFASVRYARRVNKVFSGGVVTIPDIITINGILHKVKYIPDNAFTDFTGLVGVVFDTLVLADLVVGNTPFPNIKSTPNSFVRFVHASRLEDLPDPLRALTSNFNNIFLGTESVACFKEGSKILSFSKDLLKEEYVPIEDLRKGDLVKTLKHGYLRVDMIGKKDIYHPASPDRIKDQLYVCSPTAYPDLLEELVITGCHSLLVDDFASTEQREKTIEVTGKIYVTDKKYRLPACVDDKTTVLKPAGTYTIYHLALENDEYYGNYGIWSNGLLVESCSKRYLKELSGMTLIE